LCSVATPKFTGIGLSISYCLLSRYLVNGKISSFIPGLSDKSGRDRFALQLGWSSRLVYSRRRGVKSQLFCSTQAIILRAIAIRALARFVLAAGWVDSHTVNDECVGVLSAALLYALRVINELKCLFDLRHVLTIPCTPNTQCIRFALNQSIDGYLPLPHAAHDRRPVSRSG